MSDEKESEIKRRWVKRAYRKIKQKDDEGRWLGCEPTRIRIRIRSRIRISDRILPDRATLRQKEATDMATLRREARRSVHRQ